MAANNFEMINEAEERLTEHEAQNVIALWSERESLASLPANDPRPQVRDLAMGLGVSETHVRELLAEVRRREAEAAEQAAAERHRAEAEQREDLETQIRSAEMETRRLEEEARLAEAKRRLAEEELRRLDAEWRLRDAQAAGELSTQTVTEDHLSEQTAMTEVGEGTLRGLAKTSAVLITLLVFLFFVFVLSQLFSPTIVPSGPPFGTPYSTAFSSPSYPAPPPGYQHMPGTPPGMYIKVQ